MTDRHWQAAVLMGEWIAANLEKGERHVRVLGTMPDGSTLELMCDCEDTTLERFRQGYDTESYNEEDSMGHVMLGHDALREGWEEPAKRIMRMVRMIAEALDEGMHPEHVMLKDAVAGTWTGQYDAARKD